MKTVPGSANLRIGSVSVLVADRAKAEKSAQSHCAARLDRTEDAKTVAILEEIFNRVHNAREARGLFL